MKKHKNIFIDGFRDPSPVQPLNDILLSDIRADGDNKLVLFDILLNSIIIYKGVNRQFEKQVELKNVSALIQYYDQEARSPQPNIALASENGFYIYRGLKQSFRLRIPNLEPQLAQQELWSKYQNNPQVLTLQLIKLSANVRLTQTAKYFIGSNTIERKKQLIVKAFTDGLIQKDSICGLAVIKLGEQVSPGNVVICTELKKLYVLDNFGHSIIKKMDIQITAHQVFAYGQYQKQYTIAVIGRQNRVYIYTKLYKRSFDVTERILNGIFDYPNLYLLTANSSISVYNLEVQPKKLYSLKLSSQPIQIQLLKTRNVKKVLIVGFQNQIKIYNERLLICVLPLKQKFYRMKFGTFGRQQGCLVIIYESKGFEIKIIHRQFDPKLAIAKSETQQTILDTNIPIPKKTSLFVSELEIQSAYGSGIYKAYQKDLRILKWRVLKQQLKNYDKTDGKIKINTNILGLGPIFILKLQIQNLTEEPIYNLSILLNYNSDVYQISAYTTQILMLIPHFNYPQQIQFTNVSEKGQSDNIKVCISGQKIQTLLVNVQIPACEILQ